MEHKLSQLMREGLKYHGQAFDGFAVETPNGLCTCAIGAVAVGYLKEYHGHAIAELIPEYEIEIAATRIFEDQRYEIDTYCPVDNCEQMLDCITDCCAHLNDTHLWKREQIADWLESIGY